ncbi:MAG: Co2+/Mg2+ efflux protein ApaG [Gammaproteobacteria bacterium]|jgi:ApaG protein|nr:Co2+/Mg2+ efflux protein ApaG [Gammaproteobacteria bacterium]
MNNDLIKLGASIRVEAISCYLAEQSQPDDRRFVFAYTINIYNAGDATAQLLTRHWLITDADGRVQEVHGDGVIGEQPHIKPGETHTYSSGAVLETPVGTMEGRYGMVSADGVQFDTPIPVFSLAVPGVLN